MVRRYWPERLGTPPARDGHRRTGLRRRPHARHRADGRASAWSTATACGTTPRASRTGTRSGPATASASCPARRRCGSTPSAAGCPTRACPATTRSARCKHLRTTPDIAGYDHSWFVLTQKIIEKEFALSGSEQNPDITAKDRKGVPARARCSARARPARSRRSSSTAPTSSSPTTLEELVARMNGLTDEPLLDVATIRAPDRGARPADRQPVQQGRPGAGHPQLPPLPRRPARAATATPHRILDPAAGPLIGVQAAHPDPQDARRHPDRPRLARARRRRAADRRPVRGRRGRRLRRRRRARLQRPGGHVPRRLPLQRPRRGSRRSARPVNLRAMCKESR